MTNEERRAMLENRIARLMDEGEFGEAADLLGEYCRLRREAGLIVPLEDRRSVCDDCPDKDGCEGAIR